MMMSLTVLSNAPIGLPANSPMVHATAGTYMSNTYLIAFDRITQPAIGMGQCPARLAVDGGWYFSDGPSPQRPPEAGRCSAHAVMGGAPFDVSGSGGTGGLVKAVVDAWARSAMIAPVASATSGNSHGPE